MFKQGYWKFAPFLAGVGASILYISVSGWESTQFGDAIKYLTAAKMIVSGDGFPRYTFPPFFQPFFLPPLYPYFVSLLWIAAPGSIVVVKLAQIFILGATCSLIYSLGLVIHQDRRGALIGAVIYALNPFALATVADVQTEPLHTLLICVGICALMRAISGDVLALKPVALSGLAFGLASLCRPTALPVGFALAIGLWVIVLKRRKLTYATFSVVLFVGSLFLAILPWTFANWRSTGELILINDAGGYHFWLGNHPAVARIYEGNFSGRNEFNQYTYQYLQIDLPKSLIRDWEGRGGYENLSLRQREQRWWAEAVNNAKSNPGLTARLWMEKAWTFWRPWLHPGSYSLSVVVMTGVYSLSLFGMAFYSTLLLRKMKTAKPFLLLLGLSFVASTVVHAAAHAMVRYRLPYVDPFLCLLAGVSLLDLGRRLSIRARLFDGLR